MASPSSAGDQTQNVDPSLPFLPREGGDAEREGEQGSRKINLSCCDKREGVSSASFLEEKGGKRRKARRKCDYPFLFSPSFPIYSFHLAASYHILFTSSSRSPPPVPSPPLPRPQRSTFAHAKSDMLVVGAMQQPSTMARRTFAHSETGCLLRQILCRRRQDRSIYTLLGRGRTARLPDGLFLRLVRYK